jgi:hypothetical protein
VDHTFDQLMTEIGACNQRLYSENITDKLNVKARTDDNNWQQAIGFIEQRALLLQQLSAMTAVLDQQQINRVGQLYQVMLDSDEDYLTQAQAERLKVRNALRAIKNAEKALPAYKSNG